MTNMIDTKYHQDFIHKSHSFIF